MVQHVWERCKATQKVDEVVIATEDERIIEAAKSFGAKAVMTRSDHPTGTDRVAEVANQFPEYDILINVQGDEPLISPELIDELAEALRNQASIPMITAATPIEDAEQIDDPNVVKVVLTTERDAVYFSRSKIPYERNLNTGIQFQRHLGIYGFQREFLLTFVSWPPSLIEQAESLEQLRAVERGVRIRVVHTNEVSPGIDTPEQAAALEALLNSK